MDVGLMEVVSSSESEAPSSPPGVPEERQTRRNRQERGQREGSMELNQTKEEKIDIESGKAQVRS